MLIHEHATASTNKSPLHQTTAEEQSDSHKAVRPRGTQRSRSPTEARAVRVHEADCCNSWARITRRALMCAIAFS
eukprot:269091-Prymnesium_polylepis.2